MKDFLKIAIVGFFLYHLFPKRKPEPVKDITQDGMPILDDEVEEMLNEEIHLQEKCPKGFLEVAILPAEGVFETSVLPGLCLVGSAVLDGPVYSFGPAVKAEAAELQKAFDTQRELSKAPYVTFLLANDTSEDSTVNILKSNDSFDPTAASGQVTGLLKFDGIDDIVVMSTQPTLTGSKRVTFRCWIDQESGYSTVTPDILFSFGDTNTDKLFVGLRGAFLYVNPSNTGSQVMTFPLAGWGEKVLDIEIIKILNGTPEGEITSVTINGVAQTLGNPGNGGATGANGDVIGGLSGASGLLNDATVWDIKIYDQTGTETLIHSFPGQPAANVNSAWDDTVGALTATVLGNPDLRDVNVSAIETPPAAGQSDDPAVGFQSNITYDQINRDFAVNPIRAFHLKIVTTTTAQLLKPITVKNSMVTGADFNYLIRVQNYVSAENSLKQVVDIPLPAGIYLDRNTFFEYVLVANETITLIFYYQQLNPMDKLSPVDMFVNEAL